METKSDFETDWKSSIRFRKPRWRVRTIAAVMASILAIAAFGPSIVTVAYGDEEGRLAVFCNSYGTGVDITREGRSETISFREWLSIGHAELLELFDEVGCSGISVALTGGTISGQSTSTFFSISVIEDRFIDQDGDGVDDFQLLTRTAMQTWTGLLEGHSTVLQVFRRDLAASISHGDARVHFIGTVGDSEPGSLEFMLTFIADISDPSHITFTTRYIVIEGLAHEGLEGICGGGFTSGSGPITGPFTSTSNFKFAFGSSCNNFDPFA